MDNRYRICLIVPSGYIHSKAFLETAFLLKLSLEDNGALCDITVNAMDREKINILLGYHLAVFREEFKEYKYIPYQLEQISSDDGVYSSNIKKLLINAFDVWDYSMENIEFMKSLKVSARYLPPGYHRGLEKIIHQKKDIDILFFGSMNKRRKKVMDELQKFCGVKKLFGVYQDERDSFISRSRIVLNIHHYSARIFESVRISYLLNNGCFVVSEESQEYPYKKVDLPLVPYERIAGECETFLAAPSRIEERAKACYGQFKMNYNMTEMLGDLLQSY